MKKILYLVSTLQKAGPVNQLSYIIKYLDKTKFEPIILTLSPEPQKSMKEYFLNELDIRVETIGLSKIKGLFFSLNKIENFILENKIDMIHSQGFRADVLSSKIKINIPKIATIRNYPQLDFPMTYGTVKGKIMTYMQIKALKKLNVCCGVSNAVENNLKNNFKLNNTMTVRNGVDINKYFKINKEAKKQLREKNSIPTNKNVWITSIGKDLRKDSVSIAKAFRKLYKEDSNHYIIFLGEGALKKECQTILSDIKDCLFTGKIDNVVDYLQISDYFISASKAEGLPNAVLEAMACGLPQILSDIPPHKEIIQLDKNIGILFELGNIDELYKGMKQILNLEYEDVSKDIINIVNKNLEASQMSKQYQNIYLKLLN